MINHVVLVSGVSKSESLYVYIYSLFLRFFPHTDHYRVLSRVPCAVQ